ncbi:MAG: hypothetical protein HZA79_01830 [Sphingobacteriales bacterium]|nr:hypothetical protein [Sphingobacteriales bacterium]
MENSTPSPPVTPDIETFRRIRKSIGILGVSLPVVLVLFSLVPFFHTRIQPSISHYYHTNLRDLFTGVLCAVGLFLLRYKGHYNKVFWKNDSLLTNIAGVMAFGVAFFPTGPVQCADKIHTLIPFCYSWLGWLHYGFAGVFFLALSIISICVFTIGQKTEASVKTSLYNENHIYKTCGYLMLLFFVLTPVCDIFNCFNYSTITFEALMLFAFGISWLIKGRILGDKGKIGRHLYNEINK